MVTKAGSIRCPHFGSEQVSRNGHNKAGKQRYLCKNPECPHRSFVEEYSNKAWDPKIREQVLKLAIDCTGTRATGRILGIAKDSVTSILKKTEGWAWQVNQTHIQEHPVKEVDIVSSEQIDLDGAEMDEMWSFVHDKSQQYWLWWAVEYRTGVPLAYCFGTREHKHLDELRILLAPFHIHKIYADDNYAYKKHITESTVVTGKRNTQRIERNHLSLRTWCSRLVRKGIRFSKLHLMHRVVIGLIINCRFWGRPLPIHLL